MKRRMVLATLVAATSVLVLAGVAVAQGKAHPLRKGTIEVYLGADGQCRTSTTPFFSVSIKGNRTAMWEIRDETDGCSAANDIEIRFDKKSTDPFPKCNKRGKKLIQCDLAGATVSRHAYSVWIGTQQEDPELDIAP